MSIFGALKTKNTRLLQEYNHSFCFIDLTLLWKNCKLMILILFQTTVFFSGLQIHLTLQKVYIM